MGKFDGVLFTSDIDGTLYADDFKLHKENKEALQYFTSEGGKFALSTGRTLKDVLLIGKDICNTYCIGNNGGIIGDNTEVVYTASFEPDIYNEFENVTRLFPFADAKFFNKNGIVALNPNIYTKEHQKLIPDKIEYINCFDEVPRDSFMAAFWADTDKIPLLREYFNKIGLDKRCNCYQGYKFSFECNPIGTDKGFGAKRLKEILGAKTLITAGDNENDVPMLKVGDISFVPKNAKENVKPMAKVKLSRSAEQCIMPEIIDSLEKFLRRNNG